jgi:hypothetical protein
MIKPAPEAHDRRDMRATGGRHDEGGTTHGVKRPSRKKDSAKPADEAALK